uniref:Uncharacterized protein n=1 Tax=Candidatus Kentrum sp. FM TaxID=2126340 RepID=A0A450TY62_9GAMM|nr:MAG: hypothetical protein BECKFM1743A_GA0114220_107732 [Candidatus Kentron sp. FM]VFK22054.1 MAG: hypothetical protein BECKFM1743B_GA0114221_108362 [Candidatus Kentron sp. FM]
MNYFKHVQRGRRALGILRLTLKPSEAAPQTNKA